MREEGVGVFRQRAAPQGLLVRIRPALAPAERSQHEQQRGGRRRDQQPRPPRGQPGESLAQRAGTKHDRRDARQVLEVIRHEREAHRVDVEEPRNGEQRADEEQHGGQRTPAARAPCPEQRHHAGGRERVKIGAGLRGVDPPARVEEDQWVGPEQLAGVKPGDPARDEAALEEAEIPVGTVGADVVVLEIRGVRAERGSQQEQRRQGGDVPPADPAAPPPGHQQQRRRQAARDRLGQQRAAEQRQREGVRAPPLPRRRARPVRALPSLRPAGETQIHERRPEVQRGGEHVLALGDPGHRFDVHRMHREDRRGHPGPGDAEAAQQDPEQDRVESVQQDVHQVVTEWLEPPETALQPETREHQGVVLRAAGGFEPDPPQAVDRLEVWGSSSRSCRRPRRTPP